MVFNEVRRCVIDMLMEINRLSKGEIEEDSKKDATTGAKKEIDYDTYNILAKIKEIEEDSKFDANLYVCQLVAIQDEWRKYKSKPVTQESKEEDKKGEGQEGE